MPLKAIIEELLFSPFLILAIVGLVLVFRFKKGGNVRVAYRIGVWGLLFILFLTSQPLVVLVSLPLQSWIPNDTHGKVEAIVVPGSLPTHLGAASSTGANRAYLGVRAFLSERAPLLLLSGGSGKDDLSPARSMEVIARGMGVPEEKIVINSGLNSYDEALSARGRLKSYGVRKILLVTTWFHMPRAIAVWEKQGFEVVSHPVPRRESRWYHFFSWYNLIDLQLVCHEYLGMVVYKIRGWI